MATINIMEKKETEIKTNVLYEKIAKSLNIKPDTYFYFKLNYIPTSVLVNIDMLGSNTNNISTINNSSNVNSEEEDNVELTSMHIGSITSLLSGGATNNVITLSSASAIKNDTKYIHIAHGEPIPYYDNLIIDNLYLTNDLNLNGKVTLSTDNVTVIGNATMETNSKTTIIGSDKKVSINGLFGYSPDVTLVANDGITIKSTPSTDNTDDSTFITISGANNVYAWRPKSFGYDLIRTITNIDTDLTQLSSESGNNNAKLFYGYVGTRVSDNYQIENSVQLVKFYFDNNYNIKCNSTYISDNDIAYLIALCFANVLKISTKLYFDLGKIDKPSIYYYIWPYDELEENDIEPNTKLTPTLKDILGIDSNVSFWIRKKNIDNALNSDRIARKEENYEYYVGYYNIDTDLYHPIAFVFNDKYKLQSNCQYLTPTDYNTILTQLIKGDMNITNIKPDFNNIKFFIYAITNVSPTLFKEIEDIESEEETDEKDDEELTIVMNEKIQWMIEYIRTTNPIARDMSDTEIKALLIKFYGSDEGIIEAYYSFNPEMLAEETDSNIDTKFEFINTWAVLKYSSLSNWNTKFNLNTNMKYVLAQLITNTSIENEDKNKLRSIYDKLLKKEELTNSDKTKIIDIFENIYGLIELFDMHDFDFVADFKLAYLRNWINNMHYYTVKKLYGRIYRTYITDSDLDTLNNIIQSKLGNSTLDLILAKFEKIVGNIIPGYVTSNTVENNDKFEYIVTNLSSYMQTTIYGEPNTLSRDRRKLYIFSECGKDCSVDTMVTNFEINHGIVHTNTVIIPEWE